MIAMLLPGFFSCNPAKKAMQQAAARYAAEGYRLVWSDEFNRNGAPDTANWNYEKGFVRNEEDQWYG